MVRSFTRNLTLDLTRSIAIVLMVVFHFVFDLKITGYHELDIPDGEFWVQFRNLILTLFMGCVGVSLAIAHRAEILWFRFLKRLALILAAAALVTVASWIIFPNQWIYFGVLHFVVVASLICLPLTRRPQVALFFGLTLIVFNVIGIVPYGWPIHYLADWLPSYSYDFVNPIPWIGMVCLGVWIGHQTWLLRDPLRRLPGIAHLSIPGRHSLAIYLLHQPILLGTLWLVNRVT